MKEIATIGGGCFWCVEAVFVELIGVEEVMSGYMGGHVDNPTYQDICTGRSGHAEVTQITYDPDVISYEQILQVFFATHDPTTLNRQGHDVGTQYRSVIFYHDEAQKEIAERVKKQITDEQIYDNPIVTEITAAPQFYPAEANHHDYYARNPYQPYCMAVITPKVSKFRSQFKELRKVAV